MSDTSPASQPGEGEPGEPRGGPPRLRIALIVLIALLALAGGAVTYLLVSSTESTEQWALIELPKEGTPYVDGKVREASGKRFELVTEKNKVVVLHVRPPDRALIDIQHAKYHAALGQPLRLYYRKDDGRKYLIHLTDSPVIF